MDHLAPDRPRIVVTVQSPEKAANEEAAWRKNDRYLEGVQRHGGEVVVLDETSSGAARASAFATMDGLLLSGGADLDPALYGEAPHPATVVEPERDRLEQAAFAAAEMRGTPIFGICRGMQLVNVLRGGSLVQDLPGHNSPTYPAPEAHYHHMQLESGSSLERILGETEARVNTYHHQAVRRDQLGNGLRLAGTDGELVEALEGTDPNRWLVAVQSHPERTEFTSPEFENLWAEFIAAARDFRRGSAAPPGRRAARR